MRKSNFCKVYRLKKSGIIGSLSAPQTRGFPHDCNRGKLRLLFPVPFNEKQRDYRSEETLQKRTHWLEIEQKMVPFQKFLGSLRPGLGETDFLGSGASLPGLGYEGASFWLMGHRRRTRARAAGRLQKVSWLFQARTRRPRPGPNEASFFGFAASSSFFGRFLQGNSNDA